ncbi:Aldehyde dehydrogenase 8 member A1 [Coelomomyces lativittatus]|nr:Aldehyde dehydrogenase 8 member A1 [Coelomomyces lativittatus]KAJ1513965.1 Aldehyde dehydrogenase 8 member A1 [Coelomomyces lativittatus]
MYLLAGNTCVCKPSEVTSHTAWLLCHVLKEAKLPPGVVNMIFGTGPEAGEALVRHPDVPLISFTGGSETGKRISSLAGSMLKKVSLELGGKNAGIVFEDADLPSIIPTCVRASFLNQGQICLCVSRWFVHSSIYTTFLTQFLNHLKTWTLGDPSQEHDLGPLVSKPHLEKVRLYLQDAQNEGAELHTVHTELPTQGYFCIPTVITGLPSSSKCMQEEIFGPVVCVSPFHQESEVLEKVNATKYGLCASLFTSNLTKAHTLARKIKVGTVWINSWMLRDLNMPFGGLKESGIGREGWPSSLHFFTEETTICLPVN